MEGFDGTTKSPYPGTCPGRKGGRPLLYGPDAETSRKVQRRLKDATKIYLGSTYVEWQAKKAIFVKYDYATARNPAVSHCEFAKHLLDDHTRRCLPNYDIGEASTQTYPSSRTIGTQTRDNKNDVDGIYREISTLDASTLTTDDPQDGLGSSCSWISPPLPQSKDSPQIFVWNPEVLKPAPSSTKEAAEGVGISQQPRQTMISGHVPKRQKVGYYLQKLPETSLAKMDNTQQSIRSLVNPPQRNWTGILKSPMSVPHSSSLDNLECGGAVLTGREMIVEAKLPDWYAVNQRKSADSTDHSQPDCNQHQQVTTDHSTLRSTPDTLLNAESLPSSSLQTGDGGECVAGDIDVVGQKVSPCWAQKRQKLLDHVQRLPGSSEPGENGTDDDTKESIGSKVTSPRRYPIRISKKQTTLPYRNVNNRKAGSRKNRKEDVTAGGTEGGSNQNIPIRNQESVCHRIDNTMTAGSRESSNQNVSTRSQESIDHRIDNTKTDHVNSRNENMTSVNRVSTTSNQNVPTKNQESVNHRIYNTKSEPGIGSNQDMMSNPESVNIPVPGHKVVTAGLQGGGYQVMFTKNQDLVDHKFDNTIPEPGDAKYKCVATGAQGDS